MTLHMKTNRMETKITILLSIRVQKGCFILYTYIKNPVITHEKAHKSSSVFTLI